MSQIKESYNPFEELKEQLSNIQSDLKAIKEKPPVAPPDELLTRDEAADLLRITLPTLRAWTKKEWLTAHMLGDRVYYKRNELLSALIPTRKTA